MTLKRYLVKPTIFLRGAGTGIRMGAHTGMGRASWPLSTFVDVRRRSPFGGGEFSTSRPAAAGLKVGKSETPTPSALSLHPPGDPPMGVHT